MNVRECLDKVFGIPTMLEKQIDVYIDWTMNNRGWLLLNDRKILKDLPSLGIESVFELTPQKIDEVLNVLAKKHGDSEWARKECKTIVYRFIRHYEARTRQFTMNPRRVPMI